MFTQWVAGAAAVSVGASAAQAIFWKAEPATNTIQTATNWVGEVTPSGANSAQFGPSTLTTLSNSGNFIPAGWEFAADSPGYTISGGTLYSTGASLMNILGGSGAHSFNGFRPRNTGSIINNSTGLLSISSTDGLLLNPSSSSGLRTLTFGGSGNITLTRISRRNTNDNAAVVKEGAGTLTILGANPTAATSSGIGFVTGDYTITAGTFQAGASDIIADVSNLILNGGTYATGGFDETFTTSLKLNASSTIDLGAADSIVTFADTSAVTWTGTLTIANWSGNTAGGGADGVFFGAAGLTATQLSQISFTGYEPGVAILSSGEIVPTGAAVPEPAALSLLGVIGLLAGRRRRA